MAVSRLEELLLQAADRIWLVPITADEGGLAFNWCSDPAPAPGMDRAEAVEYVRADVHRRELSRLRDERAHEIGQAVMQARKEWAAQADPDYLKERDARVIADTINRIYSIKGLSLSDAQIEVLSQIEAHERSQAKENES